MRQNSNRRASRAAGEFFPNRRAFVLGGLAALTCGAARAEHSCQMTMMGQICRADVALDTFASVYDPQHKSQWCWAACISMLFNYYDHPVSQERVVSEAYGSIDNIPAGSGLTIARQLSRDWVDDNGDSFSARLVAAFDADAGVNALPNDQILQALSNDTPLIMGARSHAMVLTALEYAPTPMGPNVVAGYAFDPWPQSTGVRQLAPDEMLVVQRGGSLRFVALADISD